jgi:hypothetical protein
VESVCGLYTWVTYVLRWIDNVEKLIAPDIQANCVVGGCGE